MKEVFHFKRGQGTGAASGGTLATLGITEGGTVISSNSLNLSKFYFFSCRKGVIIAARKDCHDE